MTDNKITAQNIRNTLKAEFPTVKFSVRCAPAYSGGSAIDVEWTDGPTEKRVDALLAPFKPARDRSYGLIMCVRAHSTAALEAALNWYNTTQGNPKPMILVPEITDGRFTISAHLTGIGAASDDQLVYCQMRNTEL